MSSTPVGGTTAQLTITPAEIISMIDASLGQTKWREEHSHDITIADFKSLYIAQTLVPDRTYKITNFGGEGIKVLVYAINNQKFNKMVRLLDREYHMAVMTMEYVEPDGAPAYYVPIIKAYDFIAGVMRNIDNNWGIITTGGHDPLEVASIANNGDNGFRLTYKKSDYTDVVTLISTNDEAYAARDVNNGAGVGLQYADVALYRTGTIRANIFYSGGWQKVGASAADISVATSGYYCLITHPTCELYSGGATAQGELFAYLPIAKTSDATTTRIGFKDGTNQILNPAVFQSNFNFERKLNAPFLNTESDIVNANIWITGMMMRKFS